MGVLQFEASVAIHPTRDQSSTCSTRALVSSSAITTLFKILGGAPRSQKGTADARHDWGSEKALPLLGEKPYKGTLGRAAWLP